MRSSYSGHHERGLPGPALTDWLMVIPSIFRAGTCFMGFRAWNSSENCGDKALVVWEAWPELAEVEEDEQEDPRPAAHPHLPPLGKALAPRPRGTRGGSMQYPNPEWLLNYRLHANGLAVCFSLHLTVAIKAQHGAKAHVPPILLESGTEKPGCGTEPGT